MRSEATNRNNHLALSIDGLTLKRGQEKMAFYYDNVKCWKIKQMLPRRNKMVQKKSVRNMLMGQSMVITMLNQWQKQQKDSG